jgi:type IV secretion system protein VirD4
MRDVQNLALLMVDPEGQGLRPGDHWQKTAHSLLVGCVLHLCYKSRHDGSPATFAALGQMLSDPKRPIADLWAEMLCFPHNNGANHPVVGASARDMLDRPPNEAGSVLSTTKSYLDLFRDPTIAKNTSRSDFRINELMNYVDPISLYIVTKPNDKARLKPLVRIVVNMIVRLLADKLDFENGRPKPSYKHRLLAMIDEFPALGKLEILQESLAFVAGYGIKCYLISQDINQLKSCETGYGPDETITSNCHIQTAFPPNRLDTAEHLSKLTRSNDHSERTGYEIPIRSRYGCAGFACHAGGATTSPHTGRMSPDARAAKARTRPYHSRGRYGGLLRRFPGHLRPAASLFPGQDFRRTSQDSAAKA